jgi:predicted ATP-dependent endonuclease of OLD family
MILREIKISGLFGYIDKHIKFHPDVNLLVGINGSGKTSILNLISWMLNPFFIPDLCLTQFQEISLKIRLNKNNYDLLCRKTGKKMTYYVLREGTASRPFYPLEIALARFPESYAGQAENRKKMLETYSELTPTAKELKTFNFLQTIPKPVILGLDRTLVRTVRDPGLLRQQAPASSVEQLQDLANQNYNIYQSRIVDLNNRLRDQIVISAFDVNRLRSSRKSPHITIQQIEQCRRRFTAYLEQNPKPKTAIQKKLHKTVERYFNRLEKLLTPDSKFPFPLERLTTEFQQVKQLILQLEKLDIETERAYSPVRTYLEVLNGFFMDSSKTLLFTSDTNRLCFQVIDKNGTFVGGHRSVELLSSGERQILSLFTFIKFIGGKIFIIDEPELSLHPRWQQNFLEAIKALMPPKTQLILATHSPAIVGRNISNCITLLPYNQ